jgi:predicted DNA-binding transcriptional regulator AlpA
VPDQLMSVGAIAQLLGVTTTRADQRTRERGFPEHAADVDTGGRKFRAWRRADVEAWLEQRRDEA